MINQIRSNLRSKVFIFFLIIVLVYTSMGSVDAFFGFNSRYKNEIVLNRNFRLMRFEEFVEFEKSSLKYMLPNEIDMTIFDNYDRYRNWQIEIHKEIIKIYEDPNISIPNAYNKVYGLDRLLDIGEMYVCSDTEGDRPFFKDLYSEELKKYGKLFPLDDLDFSMEKLNRLSGMYSEESSAVLYNKIKMNLDKYFYDLDNNYLPYDHVFSPWNYIANLSYNSFFILALSFIILVLSLYFVMDGKNTRSKQLFDTMPMKRNKSVYFYLFSSIITILIFLIISVGIPFLLIGFKNGFSGLKSGIFVFEKGFKGFEPYEHLNKVFGFIGYGKIMSVDFLEAGLNGGQFYPSRLLSLWSFWKFLLLTGILGFLKLITLSLLGTSIGLVFEKQNKSMVAIFFTLIIYIISQFGQVFGKYNPLAMGSSWEISLGYMPMTWFGGVLLLSIFSIIVFIITSQRLKKMDL